jgi:hypothetical protein
MEDAESDDTARDRVVPGELIKEANTAIDRLVHTRFWSDKVRRQYFRYYQGCRIIIGKGVTIEEFDERAPRVWALLDAQEWTNMAEDHCPAVEVIMWEFYANLHQRRGDSFCTWLRGTAINVTPTLISAITGAPCVRDPAYQYPVNHLPARVMQRDLVGCSEDQQI